MLARELAVATAAVTTAAEIARGRLRSILELTAKGSDGDLVTDVDIACEKEIVRLLRLEFPDHAISVEETTGHTAESRWRWVVDPLDGTNNYAYALPMYGVAVALCHDEEPVLACLHEGAEGSLITATKGAGVVVDGVQWRPGSGSASRPSAALWLGYGVDRDDRMVRAIFRCLSKSVRRTFENWAPTVDVALYLRGGIDVVVGYRCEGNELPAALLVLREAGARIVDTHAAEVSLTRLPPLFLAGRPDVVDRIHRQLGPLMVA
jgi:myo-inositol-1(or 4)-monophosphatase